MRRFCAAPALQAFKPPAQVGNCVVEFGGFATAAVVGNETDDQGWRAHHHPAK